MVAMRLFICLLLCLSATSCLAESRRQSMEVNATAYTSRKSETSGNPFITAWGVELTPDVKGIAVSRDLIDLGLTNGTTVRIDELEGEYRVVDKMHPKWEKKIDVYFGRDVEAALEWGVREVTISWLRKGQQPEKE